MPRVREADPYEILGVSTTAAQEEIEAAYRRAALKWHPDKNKSKKAAAKFRLIWHAASILRDPDRRRSFDLQRSPHSRQPPSAEDSARPQEPPIAKRPGRSGPRVHTEDKRRGHREIEDPWHFRWMGIRWKEEALNWIVGVLTAAAMVLVLVNDGWPGLSKFAAYCMAAWFCVLFFVLYTSSRDTLLVPADGFQLRPGVRAMLVSPREFVPLFSVPDPRGRADLVAQIESGAIGTITDMRWHPEPTRERYKVRTSGGDEGWALASYVRAVD